MSIGFFKEWAKGVLKHGEYAQIENILSLEIVVWCMLLLKMVFKFFITLFYLGVDVKHRGSKLFFPHKVSESRMSLL